jgi:hypothetical protein
MQITNVEAVQSFVITAKDTPGGITEKEYNLIRYSANDWWVVTEKSVRQLDLQSDLDELEELFRAYWAEGHIEPNESWS